MINTNELLFGITPEVFKKKKNAMSSDINKKADD